MTTLFAHLHSAPHLHETDLVILGVVVVILMLGIVPFILRRK